MRRSTATPMARICRRCRWTSLADLDAVVVRGAGRNSGGGSSTRFAGCDVGGKAVLVRTGWDVHWGTRRYLSDNPFLTAEAAEYLRREGAALVGIDSLNIDELGRPARPVHSILLGGGDPDRRSTSAGLGRRARSRLPLLGRAGQGRGVRHLAGAGFREARRPELPADHRRRLSRHRAAWSGAGSRWWFPRSE